jgi:hypothetical protein
MHYVSDYKPIYRPKFLDNQGIILNKKNLILNKKNHSVDLIDQPIHFI